MDFPLANTYGVRSELFLQSADDYHRHRHRVNKKLNKLRRSLNIVTKDTKNYQEKNKTKDICAENYDMDPLFGDVLLYQIERDLLFAQETRLLLDVHTSKSKEKFLTSKYKKALKTVKTLLSVISNEEDNIKVLEVLTLAAIIEGSLALSRKKYSVSLYSFSIARCCLQFLYVYQTLPKDFTKELYYDIVDLVIDPALNVSAAQTKSSRVSDLNQLSKEQVFNNELIPYLHKAIEIISKENAAYITPSNENGDEVLKEITWGSYSAPIKSDDLSLNIMQINNEIKKIDDSDSASYDSALILYQDAIHLHTQEMGRTANDADDMENQEQYIILTYLKYNYLLLRVRRDTTILEDLNSKVQANKDVSKSKLLELWRESLKVNESILTSLNELKELPGIANDDTVMDSLNTLDAYYQIKKQMTLSEAYLISNKYVYALALVSNCSKILDGAKPFSDEQNEGNLPSNKDLKDLGIRIEEEKSKLYILASSFKDNKHTLSVGSKYVIDDIAKFPEFSSQDLLQNIAPSTVDIQPVNVKPVLFDIAYNYIRYDSETVTSHHLKKAAAEEPVREEFVGDEKEKKKGGFFGLFGR